MTPVELVMPSYNSFPSNDKSKIYTPDIIKSNICALEDASIVSELLSINPTSASAESLGDIQNNKTIFNKSKDKDNIPSIKPKRISRELKDLVGSSKEFLKDQLIGKRLASLKKLELPNYSFSDSSQDDGLGPDLNDQNFITVESLVTNTEAVKGEYKAAELPNKLLSAVALLKDSLSLESPKEPELRLKTLKTKEKNVIAPKSAILSNNTPKSVTKSANITVYSRSNKRTKSKNKNPVQVKSQTDSTLSNVNPQLSTPTNQSKSSKRSKHVNNQMTLSLPKDHTTFKEIVPDTKIKESKNSPVKSRNYSSTSKKTSKTSTAANIKKSKKESSAKPKNISSTSAPETPSITRSGRRVKSPGNWWELEDRLRNKTLEANKGSIKFIWGKVDVMVKQTDGKMAKMSALSKK
ncbi:hypothetical protein BB561_003156 [Smittium simulii]|uniref:Uncharacterized protein n=1 Tax=Smittium simulii TaxID=133385 RepID=A0A2T9YMM7_9FUNG|nr:hypothetical protein BB561_003156 [Smittium simulii]